MNKLNPVIYQKILLQAKEAEHRSMEKLAKALLSSVGAVPQEEKELYSFGELKEDIYTGLWKLAFNVVGYHDLESADVEKLDEVIAAMSDSFVKEIEQTLDVENKVGPNEPKLPGQV